ncbi:MAG: helix-turn-helix transcriptional regulator [Mucilaginibacter sp.]|uniref:helix-turn-helix domain-containing protein n=1 Tax=Mucilaginibacter sp. TaxID=1882438 RepID=UPI003267C01D
MDKTQYIDPVNLGKLRDRIQDLILSRNIPIEAIADRTGFTHKQVYRIIYGQANTSMSNIFAIAGAMELHIMELFIIDFKIPVYNVEIDFYRKNNFENKNTKAETKPITAANAVRSLINDGYFKKTGKPLEEKTMNRILRDCQIRFRSDFKNSEFSSALLYAVKTNVLRRYKQKTHGPFVYHL